MELNIKNRLIAGFGSIILLLILTVVVSIVGLSNLHSGVDQIVMVNNPELEQAATMRTSLQLLEAKVHSMSFLTKDAERKETAEQIKDLLQKYNDARVGLKEYFDLPGTSGEETAALGQILQSEEKSTPLINKVIELSAANRPDEFHAALDKTKSELGGWLEHTGELSSLVQHMNDAAVVVAQKNFVWSRNLALACAAVAIVLGVMITFLITRSIVLPLTKAMAVASKVADGDLTSHIDVKSNDEIGQLMKSLKGMNDNLRKMILEFRDSATDISAAATELSSSASQVSVSSQKQSESASSMAAAVEEMTVGINQIAENASESSRISTESRNLSNDGGQVIHDTVTEMNLISSSTQASAQLINDLALQSEHISSVVKVIKEVADQTNLLALNAAIEAARAGEQGRGFAVVADEVRKLAERTAKSTVEISSITDKIKNGIRGALDSMGAQVDMVNSGVKKADQAGNMIKQINTGTETVLGSVNDISASLSEQKIASGEIARQVEQIAQMAEENNAAVEATAQTARRLDSLAIVLNNTIGRFRVA